MLQQLNTKPAIETTNSSVHLVEKLNSSNYAKWSRLMHLSINGRGTPNYINFRYPNWTESAALKELVGEPTEFVSPYSHVNIQSDTLGHSFC